jgi:hypothetical protein
MNEVEEVVVTANKKVLRIYYAVLGICGALILGGHAYNYFFGDMMDDWHLNIGIGFILAIGGLGYTVGLFKPHLPKIYISDEGIRSSKSIWDSSFNWDKLKKVELHKNKIEVQYTDTGLRNNIPIPYIIRMSSKNRHELNSSLRAFCDKYNVEFDSEMNI